MWVSKGRKDLHLVPKTREGMLYPIDGSYFYSFNSNGCVYLSQIATEHFTEPPFANFIRDIKILRPHTHLIVRYFRWLSPYKSFLDV